LPAEDLGKPLSDVSFGDDPRGVSVVARSEEKMTQEENLKIKIITLGRGFYALFSGHFRPR
jgi:hypothetical protein